MSGLQKIIKAIFQKNTEPVWQQFANEKKGNYTFVNERKIEFIHKQFHFRIEAYTHYTTVAGRSYEAEYTRAIAEFNSQNNYILKITQQEIFENIGKLFGLKDIEIGNKVFDKKFLIRSNDEPITLLLLSNTKITRALMGNHTLRFEITEDEGLFDEKPLTGNYMLYYVMNKRITTASEFNNMYCLYTSVIDDLLAMGSIKPLKNNK